MRTKGLFAATLQVQLPAMFNYLPMKTLVSYLEIITIQ